MSEIIRKLDSLYQAAKDRQKSFEGTPSESYYRGQVVAYGRAVKAISLQPADSADIIRCTCKHPEVIGCKFCGLMGTCGADR